MAKQTWNNPIDKNVDWGGDESTGGLPVSGEQVQKFIKEKLTLDKFGYSRVIEDKEQYFANEELAALYDEDPIANKEYLLHEVKLPSGGSGLQYYIRAQNNLESRNFAVSIDQPCIIDFTFLSQMRESADTPYENTGERGFVQVFARAKGSEYNQVREFYCDSNVSVKLDVSAFLSSGENDIMVRITGEETQQATPALTYGITLTSLSLRADNFEWWKTFTEDFIIPFQIGGNVNKTLHVSVKGGQYNEEYEVSLGKTVYIETAYNFTVTRPDAAGVYTIEAYVENAEGTIKTNTISLNVICVMDGYVGKFVAVNNLNAELVNWSDNKVLEYSCYDSGNVSTALSFETIKDEEVIVTIENATLETGVKHTLNVPLEVDTLDNSNFDVEQVIKDDEGEYYRYDMTVDNSLGYSASAGASLFINPKLRNNSQSNRESFVNEMDGSSISAQWNGVGWGLDGWTQDSEGNKILKMFAGASVTLDYKPFAIEPARSGKTIELDLAIRNVSDYNNLAVNTSAGDVGVKLYPDSIQVMSQSLKDLDTQSVNFKDDERIRMSVVLMPNAYGNSGFNLCIVYINGVKNREFTYENNDYFQNNGELVLGCSSADVDLYGFRVYDFALTTEGVLRNLLNWETSSSKRESIRKRNDIYDANGSEVDYAKVKSMFNTFVFTGDIPSLSNPNKFKGDLIVSWANTPEWNSTVYNVECDGQGTSAKKYWKWNPRWKLKEDTKVSYADGSETTGEWIFTPNEVAIERATAKLNWASSMQAHKMGSVNSIDDLAKELGIINEAGARISVYQYPFVGFSKSVNEDGEDVYTFLGLFTFGPDKGDDNTFGYDKDVYPDLLSLEGSDNAPLPTLFRVPWNRNSGKFAYNASEEAFQYNGVNCWDFNAGSLDKIDKWIDAYNFVYECSPRLKSFEGTLESINASVSTYKDQPYDFWLPNGDVIYYEASEGAFIFADTGNGTINLVAQLVDKGYGLTSEALEGKTSEEMTELFIKARVQKFRLEMSDYWNLDDAILQRNWVEFNAATDNRAKNTYPYTLSGTFRWRSDDTDTIWPINNQGQSSKGYEVEVGDKYANGQPVWNGETSNFWNLLELAFPNEIFVGMQSFMSAMETLGGKTTGTSLEKIYAFFKKYYFDMAQEYFSQSLYNEAAKTLYESAKIAYIKGTYTNDTDPITQSLGDHYSAEKRWIVKRIIYMMSKYSYGEFSSSGTDSITVRASGNIINYTITPAMWMYPNIVNGTSIVRGKRTQPGAVCNIEVDLGGSADQQNTIQGASYIQDIGEWYDKSVSGSMIVKGRMLSNLSLGHKTEPITIAITSLTLADVPALRTLYLSRISTLGGTLDLSECMRLEECHMDGTSIIQAIFPQGGNLKKVLFSSANKYINFRNLPQLTTEGVDISTCKEGITDFLISDCANLNAMSMLYSIYTAQSSQEEHALKRIRCTGIDETVPNEVIDMLYIMAQGEYNGLDAEGVGTNGLPVFEGKIHVAQAVKMVVDELKIAFPQLKITYDTEIIPSGFTVSITSKTTFNENETIQLTAESSNPAYAKMQWLINSYGSYTSSTLSIDRDTGLVTINEAVTNTSFTKSFTIRCRSAYNASIYKDATIKVVGVKVTSITIEGDDVFDYGVDGKLSINILPENHTKPSDMTIQFSQDGVINLDNEGNLVVLTEETELLTITATLELDNTITASKKVIINDNVIATSESNAELLRVAFLNSWCASETEMYASEALKVTNIGTSFKNNTLLESFDELKYFSVTKLEPYAFYYCTALKSIDISNLSGTLAADVFNGCTSLLAIVVPKTITYISDRALNSCSSLKELTILGDCSFGYDTISSSSKVEKLTLGGNLKISSSSSDINTAYLKEYVLLEGVTNSFLPCYSKVLEKMVIPSTLDLAPVNSSTSFFGNSSNVEYIIAPDSNYKYENGCLLSFDGTVCYRANSGVSLQETITQIAGYGCSHTKVLSVPETLIYVGPCAFYGTDLPERIIIQPSCEVKNEAFQETTGIKYAKIPIAAGTNIFDNSSLEEFEIPEGVETIPYSALNNSSSLVNIIGLENVTSIGDFAFYNCKALTRVEIPNVTSIGSSAFKNCLALNEIIAAKEAPTVKLETFGSSISNYTGRNTYNTGENILYVPAGATGYDTGDWLDPLQNAEKCGFTLEYTYEPTECTSLVITADNVSGRKTTTTIHYTAITNGIDGLTGETLTNVEVTSDVVSDAFPQNTSYTDTVERTISYTYMGVTATTTITQGVWVDQSYTLDLNDGQWELSDTPANPDSSLYDGVYRSVKSKGVNNGYDTMYIDILGYKTFNLYIRSYAESNYDYVMVSQLDQTINGSTSYSDTTLVKAHTRGNQKSGTAISYYTLVEFTGIDEGEHRITVVYRKDGSGNTADDQGYVLIPKDQ